MNEFNGILALSVYFLTRMVTYFLLCLVSATNITELVKDNCTGSAVLGLRLQSLGLRLTVYQMTALGHLIFRNIFCI